MDILIHGSPHIKDWDEIKEKIMAMKRLRTTTEILSQIPSSGLALLICCMSGLEKEVSGNSSGSDITFLNRRILTTIQVTPGDTEGGEFEQGKEQRGAVSTFVTFSFFKKDLRGK